ncbi:MAG TPA: bifunctional glycosyltransferase/class I SAM-dependent methyltransferase [Patescibacteria group bacterium]|nr:bifunctional glycosyltransferase/class I SAM-dependent methyltransferase [Patescibacteria group bacterium]
MKAVTTLSVLVPVYCEEYLLEASLARLESLGECPMLAKVQVIVVDDGSGDATPAAIDRFRESLAARPWPGSFEWVFLRHERNRGKGAAIRTALGHASGELVVIHDADLEYFPEDLQRMVPLFLEQDADAVFGSRFLSGEFKRVLFYRHALANRFLTFLCDLVCDLNLTDMETCYKMVRTDLLRGIPLESRDFRIEPELAIKLAKRGARIFEVPIRYAGRSYQEGKKIGWRDGVQALGAILRFAISDHIYMDDPDGGQMLERLARAPRFSRWMADSIRSWVGQRVLEIGAGTGNLTVNLVPRKLYWASDLNPSYVAGLERLRESRPYLQVGSVDGCEARTFPLQQDFDTVICLNVVEHVDDAPGFMRNVSSVLAGGGRAIVLVPQGRWLYGSLDEALGHRLRYSARELEALGSQAGLELENLLHFNRPGVFAWWLNGKILRRRTFALWQVKTLNLLTPLFRRLDRWLPLPSLSLIAVFRKPLAAATPAGEVPAAAGHGEGPE